MSKITEERFRMRVEELKTYSDGMVFLAKEMLSKLTKDQFLEAIADYCLHCGQNEKELGKCYCSPVHDL